MPLEITKPHSKSVKNAKSTTKDVSSDSSSDEETNEICEIKSDNIQNSSFYLSEV